MILAAQKVWAAAGDVRISRSVVDGDRIEILPPLARFSGIANSPNIENEEGVITVRADNLIARYAIIDQELTIGQFLGVLIESFEIKRRMFNI